VTANSHITSSDLRPYLRHCGYQEGLLKTNFPFQKLSVPLAAFADKTYDARSACVAVLDSESPEEKHIETLVKQYRDLGAPVIFVCTGPAILWWQPTTKKLTFREIIPATNVSGFFASYRDEFSPDSIRRAKTIGRLDRRYQLSFVDIGLMPLLEEQAGKHLSHLLNRMIKAIYEDLNKPKINKERGKWLFQTSFWLLAGKILKDKEVEKFKDLDLQDPSETLQCVQTHYHSDQPPESMSKLKMDALQRAVSILSEFANLRSVTTESLAYVYENTLINIEVRKALGIHATPSYLVDYIVWQLFNWIKELPSNKRTVLEPTCGHAPFLVSAARLLREMSDFTSSVDCHTYLKNHLVGMEIDDFAREIARLSLTLADIPNPNGWNLISADIFQGGQIQDKAKKSYILLCNPPFQDFTPTEKNKYTQSGNPLRYINKAVEILWRALPPMPNGSIFGVILPQGFLHSANAASLRKYILEHYDLETICTLPENVFASSRHPSTVLIGQKRKAGVSIHMSPIKTRYVHIQKLDLSSFINRYQAPEEQVDITKFLNTTNCDLRWQLLRELWEYCQKYPRLLEIADVGQGLVYKGKDLPAGFETISNRRFKDSVKGYTEYSRDIKITETPKCKWISLNKNVIRRPQWGTKAGTPQLIMNYIRVGLGPWRLKVMIDRKGHPVTSNFLVIRPKDNVWSLEILWAIMNSPFANAFSYCHSLERNNQTGMIRSIPIPKCDVSSLATLNQLVKNHFSYYLTSDELFQPEVNPKEIEQRMFAIDAEVMRLYNLPPKLERQVLNLFSGYQRKGVDFNFDRYYPEGFDAWIPLHEYLSEEFQRSSPSRVKQWVDEFRTPELISALHSATDAFSEK
jgi:type I restriction-modification system DNA methylase subunit